MTQTKENIEIIENEITKMGYLSPKEFLNIVEHTSNNLNLKIVKTHINWATYQKRKNKDVLCYTHIFSTVNTNKKPIKSAAYFSAALAIFSGISKASKRIPVLISEQSFLNSSNCS